MSGPSPAQGNTRAVIRVDTTGNPGDAGSSGNSGTNTSTTVRDGVRTPGGRPAGDAAPANPPAASAVINVDTVGQPGVDARGSGTGQSQIQRGVNPGVR